MNELYLYGSVGDSFWGEEHFTPSMVRDQLAAMTGPITVRINSGGGVATDGQTIHNLLVDYPGTKKVIIDGVAASAASLIAMAGDKITMRAGSILMIHDPAWGWTEGRGTEDDHLRAAKILGLVSSAYSKVYAARSGMTPAAARAVMKAETYYEGEAAVAAGFVDEIDDQVAQGVAAFDYRIYAHAPQRLLTAGAAVPRARSRRAVMAMLGASALKNGESKMVKKATASTTEEDQMAEDDDLLAEGQTDEDQIDAEGETDDIAPENADGSEDEEDGAEEDAPTPKAKAKLTARAKPTAANRLAVQIVNMCNGMGRPATEAVDMISRGLTLEEALTEITAKTAKEKPVTANIRPGAPTARITRDERDTRRAGMTGALVAQMGRARDVKGPARDYMSMGIMAMAAACTGQPIPRRGAGEVRLLEMAMGSNSTSDFPAIFENALNKRLLAAYQSAMPTYQKIATRMDFTDFRPHPISSIGDFPTLLPIGEAGEIKYGSTSDKKEVVAMGSYGRAFLISRQMMINDDLGGIDRMLATRGMAVAAFEDAVFYNSLLSGANTDGPTLLETGRQVFNTTDLTKAGTAAAITVASLSAGRAAMRRKKGLGGKATDQLELDVAPSILLVGPDKETEAQQIVAPIQAQQAGNVNPFSGTLEIVTSNKISGNAWYLFADPAIAPVMMYGYLMGEEGPRMRMDEPFGTQGVAYSVELDFGSGAIDYRGGYKNAGA